MSGEFDKAMYSLCVECGPNVRIDEDGCCAFCGNGAVGTWLDGSQGLQTPAVASLLNDVMAERDSLRSQLSSTREKYEQAVRERDAANAAFDELSREVRLATLINPENPPSLATYIHERYARERDQWKANHDQRKQEQDDALRERDELRAENARCMDLVGQAMRDLERMKPVYEAAVKWHRVRLPGVQVYADYVPTEDALWDSIDHALAAKETTDVDG